jgi:acyl-coenzyme A synthetase/AMP-(fatty) acid ligase
MQLVDEILFWAKVAPHRPAVIQPDLILTYQMLADAIASSTQRIVKSDFDPHEPVAVLLDNPGKTLAVCFGLMQSGYAIAPVDAGLLPHLQAAGIRNLIHAADARIAGGRNIRFDDSWLHSPNGTSVLPGARGQPRTDAVATVFFTSGTTGAPKKTVQTREAIMERFNMVPLTGEADTDRTLLTMPLNTTFGFFGACTILRAGKTVCFSPIGPGALVLAGTYRVEAISASPQQVIAFLELVEKGGRFQLDSLKQIRVGGGSLTSKLAERIQSNLCRKLFASYGTSELGKIAGASYDMIAGIPDAVGFRYPYVDLEIVDESGAALPTGSEGLVRCRTPYFIKNLRVNNPDLAADGDDAWWYPGDVGLLTDGGVLCIAGRSDDVINLGGAKISALTLDEALVEYPGIKDAGVCGVKGSGGIDRIWVGIVPEEGESDMAKFIMSIRGNPKFGAEIDELLVVERIPRSRLGKIQRNELKAMLLRQKSVSAPRPS